jgi:hypothetical protein
MRVSSISRVLLSLLCVSSVACSSSDKDDKKTETLDPGTSTSAWTRIVEGSWTLQPGKEDPRHCTKVLLDRDIWVSAIRPVHPFGTHHTLLTLGDEKSDCTTAITNGLLYAAGVGSEGLTLPPGAAIKLPAGKYLNLGLHIYNPSDEEISGTSAMEIQEIAAEDVKYESEAVLAGPFAITLPPGKETVVSSRCDVQTDQHVYALFPHMHQLGTHIKTTFTVGGKETVIHDGSYTFDEQLQIPLDPIPELTAGDSVSTECTYVNTLPKTVTFGESSDAEMCFSILFRYPAQGQGFCASSGAATTIPGPPCAKAGDTGNDKGVGQICTKGGGECSGNEFASFCLSDVAAGEFGNFCSISCTDDTACGAGATCLGSGDRKACVPTSCGLGADAGAN